MASTLTSQVCNATRHLSVFCQLQNFLVHSPGFGPESWLGPWMTAQEKTAAQQVADLGTEINLLPVTLAMQTLVHTELPQDKQFTLEW